MNDVLVVIGAAGLAVIVGIWVYFDAKSRGMNGLVWGLFACLLLIIGLPVYIGTRKKKIEG